MRRTTVTVLTIVLAASAASGAVADANHARSEGVMPMQSGAMPGQFAAGGHGGMAGMMDMMMQMHPQMMGDGRGSGMMGSGMMGSGMMGNGVGPDMMAMMNGTFDASGDGRTTPDEVRAGMTAKIAEFDADADGGLSLAEFEALHSNILREAMVDRFQYFDADGDGTVSEAEMHRPVNRLSMMPQFRAQPGGTPDMSGDMMDGQSGSMMNDN